LIDEFAGFLRTDAWIVAIVFFDEFDLTSERAAALIPHVGRHLEPAQLVLTVGCVNAGRWFEQTDPHRVGSFADAGTNGGNADRGARERRCGSTDERSARYTR